MIYICPNCEKCKFSDECYHNTPHEFRAECGDEYVICPSCVEYHFEDFIKKQEMEVK